MNSYIKTALVLNEHARVYFADSKQMVEDARKIHGLYPTSLAALGRTMTMAAIMAQMYKDDEEKVDISINGGGPIGTIMVSAMKNGDVKGFVGDRTIYLKYNDGNKLAVGLAVGTDGYLKVTRHEIRQNFSGEVALVSGEIAEDFASYFMQSEQVPSIVSLGVLVDTDTTTKAAGGLVIQLLPGHEEADIVYLENMLKTLKPISTILDEGTDFDTLMKELFPDYVYLDEYPIRYHCDCSKDRFKAALTTLDIKDLEEILDQDGKVDIKCEYCNKEYHIDKEELETIIAYVRNQRPQIQK